MVLLHVLALSVSSSPTLQQRSLKSSQRRPGSAQLGSGVLAVEKHLEQDGHVDQDLDRTAYPELSRTFVHHKVGGLEDVARRPQQHHLHTKKETQRVSVK